MEKKEILVCIYIFNFYFKLISYLERKEIELTIRNFDLIVKDPPQIKEVENLTNFQAILFPITSKKEDTNNVTKKVKEAQKQVLKPFISNE